MENATSAGGCAWSTACRSLRILYTEMWNGSSDEGLCGPITVPSGLTQMMSRRVSVPLSTPAGVIQMLPSSSRMERLPPDMVVSRLS